MIDKKEIENLSYEDAIKKLELVLKELEDGEHTLENSLKLFKLGINLYDYCNDILSKTEGEVKILLEKNKDIEKDFLRED